MAVLIIAFLVSLIPAAIIYFWLRNHMFRLSLPCFIRDAFK